MLQHIWFPRESVIIEIGFYTFLKLFLPNKSILISYMYCAFRLTFDRKYIIDNNLWLMYRSVIRCFF